MKSTILNDVKLYWHCLIKGHRRFEMGRDYHFVIFGKHFYFPSFYLSEEIFCNDCQYGKDQNLLKDIQSLGLKEKLNVK